MPTDQTDQQKMKRVVRPSGLRPDFDWAYLATDFCGDVHAFTHLPDRNDKFLCWRAEAGTMVLHRVGKQPNDNWRDSLRRIKD